MKGSYPQDIHSRIHPWMRATAIANMLAFILGAIAIIIASSEMERSLPRGLFITIGIIASILFLILFIIFISLAIRDYRELYDQFDRHLFGIKWLKY